MTGTVIALDAGAIEKACKAHAPQWDGIDDTIKVYAREQMRAAIVAYLSATAPALPQDVAKLIAEYRPSMPTEVLHLWAEDAKAALTVQSSTIASAREVIGDIEDYIANAQSHYATLFDRGQGIHGQPGYVVDAVWNAWTGKRLLADELSRAIADIRAARDWKGSAQ